MEFLKILKSAEFWIMGIGLLALGFALNVIFQLFVLPSNQNKREIGRLEERLKIAHDQLAEIKDKNQQLSTHLKEESDKNRTNNTAIKTITILKQKNSNLDNELKKTEEKVEKLESIIAEAKWDTEILAIKARERSEYINACINQFPGNLSPRLCAEEYDKYLSKKEKIKHQ